MRQRAAELETLVRALDEVEPSEPPADLVPQVMARVAAMADDGVLRRGSGQEVPRRGSGQEVGITGRRVGRAPASPDGWRHDHGEKGNVGIRGRRGCVLGVLTYRGFPPVRGTEATVGAAKRAQAPQMAADSVTLADPEAQAFMQSDRSIG